ncbi:MAG: hypothetical protein FRX48_06426 [Lasallia pustulata]|uniref:ACB domain-containing protein n=1 Tax=Lasallia pustulata TaxID=136370 RepID=A0A5M8PMV0_9LECA|nr:MAG: hypothetical protein FRX48_06426 [Lasallia pustulata]
MSDSVDRVFVHALNTVKKIPRTGSARPPSSDRLKLYGLYKQSMEGDVEGVMPRPSGDSAEAEREKWTAWSAQHGLSRTEAKRRYISTLISTMQQYASTTPSARSLVADLEFVWDQIKPRSASSPPHPRPAPAGPASEASSSSSADLATALRPADPAPARRLDELRSRKWRARMEQALLRLATEVAALREQLEAERVGRRRRREGLWAWTLGW